MMPTASHAKRDASKRSSSMDSMDDTSTAASSLSSPRQISPPPTRRHAQRQVQVAGTEVPEDLFRDLLKAGEKARRRGQHRL
eukprot:3565607-Amphidinium_carterae.1